VAAALMNVTSFPAADGEFVLTPTIISWTILYSEQNMKLTIIHSQK
jgi:hypothetical protein